MSHCLYTYYNSLVSQVEYWFLIEMRKFCINICHHSSPSFILSHAFRTVTLMLRSVRPLLKIDTAQVRGGGQLEDGTRIRASNNLKMNRELHYFKANRLTLFLI